MMTLLNRKIKLSENCVVQQMGEGIVILNLDTERFYELNEVGKRIMELFADNNDYKTVLNTLVEEYTVTVEQLEGDMFQLIADLEKAELIEAV